MWYINGRVESLPLTDMRYISGRIESVVLHRRVKDFLLKLKVVQMNKSGFYILQEKSVVSVKFVGYNKFVIRYLLLMAIQFSANYTRGNDCEHRNK
jgi:hypothetical protein